MTLFLLIPGVFLLIVLAITASAWALQERFAFQPERPPYPDAGGAVVVQYSADDGQQLFAYVIGNPSDGRGLVIAFHGNADLAVRQIAWARELARRTGLAVMLPEYRGYMGLPGRPTYEGSRLDAQAAYRFAIREWGVGPSRLFFYGHSLGSAIAVELAAEHPPRALVLEAPFTSAAGMTALFTGRLFATTIWPAISRLGFNTLDLVTTMGVPVSVTHGGRDRVIPFWMGEAVYRAAKIKGQWLFVATASHSDIRTVGGETYWTWLLSSIAS